MNCFNDVFTESNSPHNRIVHSIVDSSINRGQQNEGTVLQSSSVVTVNSQLNKDIKEGTTALQSSSLTRGNDHEIIHIARLGLYMLI